MTVRQVQCLLVYLGYDTGGIDGVWGLKTEEAVGGFQKEYGGLAVDGDAGEVTWAALRKAVGDGWTRPDPQKPDVGVPAWWKEIEYFKRGEFRCPCGKCGGFPAEPEEKLVRLAEGVRKHFGKPVLVSSGVRCQGHNDELANSVPNSRHIRGKAMDFTVSGVAAAQVLDYVLRMGGVRYAYGIDRSYVHMDID